MTKSDDAAGIERFAEIKARVVSTYGIDPKDEQANVVASLVLARERMVEAIAAGETRVDYTAFTKVLELLKEYAPPIIPKVSLTLIGPGETVTCPQCKHEFRPPEGKERTLEQMRAEGAVKAKAEEEAKAKRRLEATAAMTEAEPEVKAIRVNVNDGQSWFGGAEKQASSFNQPAPAHPHPYRNRTPYDNGG
jgi:hypothetical protein